MAGSGFMAISRLFMTSNGRENSAAVNPAVAEDPKRVGSDGPSVMGSLRSPATTWKRTEFGTQREASAYF